MSFLIHSISNSNVVPMEYYPCATKAAIGTPMVMGAGALIEYGVVTQLGAPTGLPLYISMGAKTTNEVESLGDIDALKRIPVIRARDDIVFEATSKSGGLIAGDKVNISAASNGDGAAATFSYTVEKVAGTAVAQFEVIEAKNTGSTAQKVLIRYIG